MTFSPILHTHLVRDRDRQPVQQEGRCDWCGGLHWHGADTTMAVAHCSAPDSPYRRYGYTCVPVGDADSPTEDRPAAILAGQRHALARHLEAVEAATQAALLRPILGQRLSRRFGRIRITAKGRSWWIEPDAFPSAAEVKSETFMPGPRTFGRGTAGLLAVLTETRIGVVAVRLLETVSGIKLDARAKLAIAAEVEASCARQAETGA